jgi:hypothetical protein
MGDRCDWSVLWLLSLKLEARALLPSDEHRVIHLAYSPWAIAKCYNAIDQLLIDCLSSNCKVTVAIWQKIEATLLCPQKELEDREWQGD